MTLSLAALVLIGLAAFLVSRSALMHVRRIEVSGIEHLSASQVIRESGVGVHTNALWFAPSAAETALEQDPWVASATVTRVLPWTIRIRIVERAPVAAIAGAGGYGLIASDGTFLGTTAADPRLPQIIGLAATKDEGAPTAVGAALVVGSLDEHLRSIVRDVGVDATGAVQMLLKGGVHVDLGEPVSLSAKVGALSATLSWAEHQHLRLRGIDVSAPGVPAVRLAG